MTGHSLDHQSRVKESFASWDKAVMICGMYNRDAKTDSYYYVQKVDHDESDYLTTDRELDKVFIVDDNDNQLEVSFNVDEDGNAEDIAIEGTSIHSLDLSDQLIRMVENSVEDAIEYIMTLDETDSMPDSIYDF